jgi:hypothetical protein
MNVKTNHRATVFIGGAVGRWRVDAMQAVAGPALASVSRVAVVGDAEHPCAGAWSLTGVPSYVRYVERREREELRALQAPLARAEATCAALIPIRKSEAWWELTQEARRDIFEARSHHIANSMRFLPGIARQLYHSRDLGEPFDFLTWFEFAPAYRAAFEELVCELRSTEEWTFVTREIDIRLLLE